MRPLHMLAAFAALFVTAPLLAQSAPTGERHHVALIIGNSQYAGSASFPPLPNACSDAQNVAAGLTTIGWDETTEIDLQCDLKVDEMSAHVRRFIAALNDDPYAVGVFYFAGHGVQVDARQFIFGVDARLNINVARRQIDRNPDSQLFVNSALDVYADFIQAVGAVTDGGLTVIVDACRSDPLIQSINGDGVRRVTAPTVKTVLLPGIMLALSTQNGEVALDSGGYVDALKTLIARDKPVALIMGEVTTTVWTATKLRFPAHPQIPIFSGVPSFPCFAGCIRPAAAPAPAVPAGPGPGLAMTTERAPDLLQPAVLRRSAKSRMASAGGTPSLLHQAQASEPAPSAPAPRIPFKLITPLYVKEMLPIRRQTKGLRVDIFWCEAGDDLDGRKEAAERYAEYLKTRAEERGEGQEIGYVRLRVLTRNGNALPSYRFVRNAVLSDTNNPIATKWAGIMADTKDLLRADAVDTGDYMAMFVCSIGAQTPFPATVFWQVPDAHHVSLAKSLIGRLDEQAGNFKSMSGIETVDSEGAPGSTQVRYYYDADQTVAFRLADSLQVLLSHPVRVTYFTAEDVAKLPKPGTVEVWIGRDESADPVLGRAIASAIPSRNQTLKP